MALEYAAYAAYSFVAYKFLSSAYTLIKPCLRCGKNLRKRYGDGFAVITGGTGGLGLAYANEFARRGVNVMLVSRTESKLKKCQSDIQGKYPNVKVDYVQADLGDLTQPNITRLRDKLNSVEIACLVNNCGISYEHAEYLDEISDTLVDRLIEINVRSLTLMTRLVLPQMVARKRGDIINVTSADGTMQSGAPFYAVYSGTKGYVALFSKSLAHENKARGIHVQCHVPFYVATAMSKQKPSFPMVPTPKAWAKNAVNCIGENTTVVTPDPAHNVLDFIVNTVPESIAANHITKHNKFIRKRALRKKAILAFQEVYLKDHPEVADLDEKARRKIIRSEYEKSLKSQ